MSVGVGLIGLAYLALMLILPKGVPVAALIPGLVIGGLSAFTAMGLVLIYRSTRIINFAQANMGGVVATLVVLLVTVAHWNYLLALLGGVIAALFLGAGVERGLLGPLSKAPRLIATVATIGVAQLLAAATIFLPRLMHARARLGGAVPFHSPWAVQAHIGSLLLTSDHFQAMLAIPAVLIGLVWYFNKTDSGIGARGAADSVERAQLLGIPVRRLSLTTWMVASLLSSLGAVLLAGVQGFQVSTLGGPETLVMPMAAAVIAGLDSLTVAFVASLGIGVLQQAIFWSYPQSSVVDLIMFLLIVVALMFHRKPATRTGGDELGGFIALPRPLSRTVAALPEIRAGKLAGVLALLLLSTVPALRFNNSQLTFFSFAAIYMIVAASLVILAGWAGQVSLGQFGFVGIGAGVSGWLLTSYHASLLVCLTASMLVGVVAALVIGIPALRIRGIYLAAVTLAFALPASTFFLSSLHFPSLAPTRVIPPVLFGRFDLSRPRAFYYLCIVVVFVAFGLARNFRNSRLGRAAIAVRDNERLAAAVGASAIRIRLAAFAVSGALAGLAGSLYVVASRGIPFNGFAPQLSLQAFTMVVVGGMGSLWGAVLGALYVYIAQYFLGATSQLLVTGGGIIAVLSLAPGGLADLGYRLRDVGIRLLLRRRKLSTNLLYGRVDDDQAPLVLGWRRGASIRFSRFAVAVGNRVGIRRKKADPAAVIDGGAVALCCEQLEAGYGHLQILFGVNAEIDEREIFALLGTNGAGKSTILRVVAGLLPARRGRVIFRGTDITRLSPAERVGRGLVLVPGGRGVFGSLSVKDNLRLAAWLARRRGDKNFIDETTKQIFALFPVLEERLNQRASLLSGGEQQMLTIAQSLLCKPQLLMIDELSLGLAPAVVGALVDVVRKLNATGITVVLVEQSVNIAASIAPRALFLEKGQVRFSGPTSDLASNGQLVRSVFLADAKIGRTTAAKVHRREGAKGDAASPEVVMATQGLRKAYGGVTAIDGVDLELRRGEILGVIGANGAGKTTLFDVISGFVRADAGRLLLNGRDITRESAAARGALGLGRTFQDLRLIPSLTVAEAIAVALERHIDVREPVASTLGVGASLRSEMRVKERVDGLVEEFRLERFANSFISELSTGTRRVVELACASAHEPDVLILDEPSSGLAQSEAEAMIPLLREIKDRTGATIAIIEHDIPMIRELSDEIVCMHVGQIIARGTAETVLSDPRVIASYLGVDELALQRSGSSRPERSVARRRAEKAPEVPVVRR